ncbi:MAG: ABC transporter substrate-binding protein [Armatimonadota bacterium]|nr:ABC transporter substrate-binding protein [Armatimonadota bacterium]MDR7463076.1 ABC transporter substrate-binding protein [Armatimonadota bacterium]MDR7469341.1 ABC transporter substrate-binding protein [Armatimonadota bacterium]MDR7475600.1 ABC transporter substrate-binding protein [Armatimonadota bacterium]MDR7539255.1 ABC transporter substrate-binding protein [Armatimonadota bacterium]
MNIVRVWAMVLALLGGLGSTTSAAPPGGTVVLYTSLPQEIATNFARAFMAKVPQVKLEVLRSGSTELERRIFAEMETGGIRADVLWLADAPVFITLREKGQLLPYRSPEARMIPAAWKDPQGFFTAGRLINMIIAANTTLIPERVAPKRWADFPRYGKTAAMPNPFFSGSVFVVVATFVKEYGWDWFERARREGVQVLRGNSEVARALAAREFGVGMTLDFIAYGMIRDGAPLAIIWPEEGAVSVPSPLAITRSAKNPEGAKQFIDFVLSRDGQRALVELGIIPVRADVEPPRGLPRAAEIKTLPVPFEWAAANAAEIRKKFEEIMLK